MHRNPNIFVIHLETDMLPAPVATGCASNVKHMAYAAIYAMICVMKLDAKNEIGEREMILNRSAASPS